MLKLKHIVKDYVTKQQTIHVLKDLTLNFRECEFVTILGQSGCGKTTLLNIIGGLDRYTAGDIIINDKSTKDFDDRDWDRYRNKQIGFVFQSYNLIPHLDVLHNVELALTLAGKSQEVRKEKAMDALRKVGLEDQAYKKPNQLSGGQMQRVAIARALVNDPAIILADEPTGALDSESGTMVMELLKEVAHDRLVILVSHNSELASKYSTRTVQLKDGRITDDSDPLIEEGDDEEVYVAEGDAVVCQKKTIRQRIKKSYKQIVQERKEERKVSMNGATTISMSARNLYSKKWRTFLTSFAGSIGIIGIALVLALSSGVKNYIRQTETSALSTYPLTIQKEGADLQELSAIYMATSTGNKYPKITNVLINKVAGNLLQNGKPLSELAAKNDLGSIKRFLDKNLDKNDGYLQCAYSSNINIYRRIPLLDGGYANENYTKVSPFTDSLDGLMSALGSDAEAFNGVIGEFDSFLGDFQKTVFSELISNQEILDQQYNVIAGDWAKSEGYAELDENGNPTGYTVYDCVLQVDRYNKIADYMLFAIGLTHPSDVISMLDLFGTSTFFEKEFTAEEILGVEYMVLSDSDYYSPDGDGYKFEAALNNGEPAVDKNGNYLKTKDTKDFIESRKDLVNASGETGGIKLKISGIVRPKENAETTSISGLVGYPHALVEAVIDRCRDSAVMDAQRRNCYDALTGERVTLDANYKYESEEGDTEKNLKYKNILDNSEMSYAQMADYVKNRMGLADVNEPESISIYALSFEGKEKILGLFDDYQYDEDYNPKGQKIMYTDFFGTLMEYVKMLTNAMLTALIAFSAISLIVSSIMISIITYTSVLERRKEIGVLRSIGARKLDISNLFVSESSIIGMISGVLGIAFGYIFVAIANVIILNKLEVAKLLSLNWYYALGLIVVSFVLALVAGIIPASIAAKKDPVEALRTE